MTVKISSFSFKKGEAPEGAAVIDCRRMRNPHFEPRLKPLTGLDSQVQGFVMTDPHYYPWLMEAIEHARKGRDVAFGCFGGKHRSVAMAELVNQALKGTKIEATIEHIALKVTA